MADYRRLKAWQRAHVLALAIYRVTKAFPSEERFGLALQMRRAAVSVTSNLAEASGRAHAREFQYYVRVARGSLHELDSQTLLAHHLGYIPASDWQPLADDAQELGRMLTGLLRLRTAPPASH